jgi:hypothetical protein
MIVSAVKHGKRPQLAAWSVSRAAVDPLKDILVTLLGFWDHAGEKPFPKGAGGFPLCTAFES